MVFLKQKFKGYYCGSLKEKMFNLNLTSSMKKIKLFTPIALVLLLGSCEKDQLNTIDNLSETNENIKEIDKMYSGKSNSRPFFIGPSFYGSPGWVRSGDFNGDGREDLVELKQREANIVISNGSGVTSTRVSTDGRYGDFSYTFSGDFDGDGRADIASASGGTVYMKLNKWSNPISFTSADWSVTPQWGAGSNTVVGDFNGDGKDDIASAGGTSVFMKISQGNKFSSLTWANDGRWGARGYTLAGDFNGDGRDDIISPGGQTIHIKQSTGSGFISKQHTTTHLWGGSGYTWMADTDGNGKDEIITAMGTTIIKREWISGSQWSYKTSTTGQHWGKPGYNFAMDFKGSRNDQIVSYLVGPDDYHSLYIHSFSNLFL